MGKVRHMSKKIDIIKMYLDDYSKSMSGREIAKKSSMSHQTALNNLNELLREKILFYSIKGRNKEYTLNLSFIVAKKMAEIAENIRAIEILEEKEIVIILQELMEHSETIILFGSFASGTHNKNSDIDIVVLGKADKNSINGIRKRYSREINVEYLTFNEFERLLKFKKPLALEILKNHVIFGDVSKIVDIFWRWNKR